MRGDELLAGAWPVAVSVVALVGSAAVLVLAGTRFTRIVDRLADRTGIGEALAGAVLLGATTSLPGIVTTLVGALEGDAEFAVSNPLGGVAAQTVFLAVGDLLYRRANLEHAAASVPNLMQAIVLMALVSLVLAGIATSDVALGRVHPVSLLLPIGYLAGLRLARATQTVPMWRPEVTSETRPDVPAEESRRWTLRRLWSEFAALAVVVALTGLVVGRAGTSLVATTELSGSIVGGVFTAVVTSVPELVVVITAVRSGALTLAVGNIIGGNTFDVLMVAGADVAFAAGPIYAAVDEQVVLVLAITMLLTAVLAAGLVRRSPEGIGFEGVAMLVIYAAGFAAVHLLG